jgi:Domain of unknown function (DUF4259)
MGAWGTGSFENDDALDFVVELEREGQPAIRATLENVTRLGAREYLEAPEASAAIAASEVIAAARDGKVSQLPEEAQRWVQVHGTSVANPRFLELAQRALERILLRSELKELWEEGGTDTPQFEAWDHGVHQLAARLTGDGVL